MSKPRVGEPVGIEPDTLIQPTLENADRARRAVAAWGSFDPEKEYRPSGVTEAGMPALRNR